MEMLPAHPHPLRRRRCEFFCFGCGIDVNDFASHYYCDACFATFHKECAQQSSPEINRSFHPGHPLKLVTRQVNDQFHTICSVCGQALPEFFYHCFICGFSVDLFCVREPPPVNIEHRRCHEHTLTVLPRQISFACNACGDVGHGFPYICLQCNFVVHRCCIDLPRVIVNMRHNHRLSHAYSLRPGEWSCGICRQQIDSNCGAYSCSKDCSYALHTRCALRDDVWDGRELEGEPEETEETEETEDVEPFEKIDGKVIHHFSHEHHLKLKEDHSICDQSKRCQACILPIYSESFYSCMQCDFIIHETCANLQQKIRHALHQHPLILHADRIPSDKVYKGIFACSACRRGCSGFKYKCPEIDCDFQIDVRCASISEPFIYEGHPHPLFLNLYNNFGKTCAGCKGNSEYMLNCIECPFVLDFLCATLPQTVRHKYDEHPLTFRWGEDASGPYWCEICEQEVNPKAWFYACDECGFTPHVDCLLGDFLYAKPGQSIIYKGLKFEMTPNNRSSRPLCHVCDSHCQDTLVFKRIDKYLCSVECMLEFSFYHKET